MIEFLINEFVGTLPCILLEAWRIEEARVGHAAGATERNLGPKYDAVFVAETIHLLVVGIMCQTHKCGARFEYQLHILLVVFGQEGRTTSVEVIVAIKTYEVEVLAVEEESLVGVHIERAEARLLAHLVDDLVTIH